MPIDFEGLFVSFIGLKALYSNTLRDFWDFLRYKKYISLSLNNNNNKITRYYTKVLKKVKSKTIKAFKGLKSRQKDLKVNSCKDFRHASIKATSSRTGLKGAINQGKWQKLTA